MLRLGLVVAPRSTIGEQATLLLMRLKPFSTSTAALMHETKSARDAWPPAYPEHGANTGKGAEGRE